MLRRRSFSSRCVSFPILAWFVACLAACGSSLPKPEPQGLMMRAIDLPLWSKQYPSGLRVIAEPDSRTQTVAIVVVVGSGSSSDPPGKEGLAHYVEHLAFRSRPGGKASFEKQMERAGAARWDAMTSWDATIYLEMGSKRALGAMLKLEAQRMVDPLAEIVPDAYTAQLDIIRNELRQRSETGFLGEVGATMETLLFAPNHPYARPVGGTHATIDSFTKEDVQAFVKNHYRPDNMTLQIIGNFDLKGIEQFIAETLPKELLESPQGAAVPNLKPSFVLKAPPTPPKTLMVKREASVPTPELWIGWTLPPTHKDSRAYVAFADYAIEEAFDDISNTDNDIAGVSTAVLPGKEASVLLVRARLVKGAHPEQSGLRIISKIEEMTARPQNPRWAAFQERRFQRQKNMLYVGTILEAENILGRALSRAATAHVTGDILAYSRQATAFSALEKPLVDDFIQTYINRQRARFALFTPRTGGGETASEIGFRGETTEEDDDAPIVADTQELKRLAPGIGARYYRTITLDNGLRIILAERQGLPLVTMLMQFEQGMANNSELGAAYAARDVAKAPAGGPYGDAADFGARFTRNFGPTGVGYSFIGSSGNAEIMVAMLADTISTMTVTPDAWNSFLRNQLRYLLIVEQRPDAIADRAFDANLFPGSKHGQAFTLDLLHHTSFAGVQQWVRDLQAPNNGTLVIAGEFDPMAMERIVRQHFEPWEKSSRQSTTIPTVVPGGRKSSEPAFFAFQQPHSTQAVVRFGCVLPSAPTAALDARHDLGAALIQERLGRILRDKGGVTYGFHAVAWVRAGGTAYLDMGGAVDQSKLVFSLSAIKKTLEDFQQNPADTQELAKMKLRLARRHTARFMTNASIASAVMSKIATGYSPANLDEFADYMDKVSPEDIQADFKACFAGNPTLTIVGDEAAAKAAFKAGWQTTVNVAPKAE